jgi:hypothetical protein
MIQPRSLVGSHYFVTFINDYSRYTWIFFLRKKSDTLASFQKFKATVELAFPGLLIQAFCNDRGGEFISEIHRELTQAYTPHQNGVSERKNHTLLEKARSMFLEARTPKFLWAEAVNTANYLTNRSPMRANSGISPYQHLYKKPPSLHHLRVFGCLVFVHEPDEYRTKLEPKSRKCIFLGYSEDTKGYCCYDPAIHKIHVSNDVHFVEHCFWHMPDASLAPTPSVALEPLSSSSTAIQVFDLVITLEPIPAMLESVAPTPSPAVPSSLSDPTLPLSDPTSPPPLRVYVRHRQLAPPTHMADLHVLSSPAIPSSPAVPSSPTSTAPSSSVPPISDISSHVPAPPL